VDEGPEAADSGPDHDSTSSASEQRGRLSSPVQRRLTDSDIDALVAAYQAGSTIDTLARVFGVHRTAVMTHLERREVPRRTPRKLRDQVVADAARRYTSGATLGEIALQLDVAPSTLARELRLAGTPIRRRGRGATAEPDSRWR
jgi:AraC-like DNA-binding protein